MIPTTSAWIPLLVNEFHSSTLGGYWGPFHAYKRLASNLYLPEMSKTSQQMVAKCLISQKHKYETASPDGLLQPLPIPSQVWEDIYLDFITALPRSHGEDAIFLVVDVLQNMCIELFADF